MWKKAFLALLLLNLSVLAAGALWVGTLPKVPSVSQKGAASSALAGKAAPVEVSVGADAINAYLSYALTEQRDLAQMLTYAEVTFDTQWELSVGIKLSNRVVPLHVIAKPAISQGNLRLTIQSADMAGMPVPSAALSLILDHVPWPAWIHADDTTNTVAIDFTERPQQPYGVRVLSYSAQNRQLTLLVTIVPNILMRR